jgi:transcriptional repressor NrdR
VQCPFCGYIDQKVLESRPAREGDAIRRRRECIGCGRRFTTFEEPERPRLFVIKRGGGRVDFSREKVLNSMLLACRKRRVQIEDLHAAAERIERDLIQEMEEEVTSRQIGEKVMNALEQIDTVAYVRFASVYQDFETIDDFREILDHIGTGVGKWVLGTAAADTLR